MLNINWKPSELPVNTVVDADVSTLYSGLSTRSEFIKLNDGRWMELSPIDPDYVNAEDADTRMIRFEILSVPPSWYDEWKIFSRNMPHFRINRRGEVRRASDIGTNRQSTAITEELVRRAFSDKPVGGRSYDHFNKH